MNGSHKITGDRLELKNAIGVRLGQRSHDEHWVKGGHSEFNNPITQSLFHTTTYRSRGFTEIITEVYL